MDTIVLIPAYKPSAPLIETVTELYDMGYDIVVVDDGSGEDYDKYFRAVSPYASVLRKGKNYGKGAALKSGIKYIINRRSDCKYIITADADGQHRPSDIARIDSYLQEFGGFVIGSREFVGDVPLRSMLGNKLTIGVFSAVSGVHIGDTQTGLRGFDRSLFEWALSVGGDRYEYEMNVLLDAAKNGIAIGEIPIATVYEDGNSSSHFKPVKDSIKIYRCILNYALSDKK